ncbi:CDP-alcohol phosphatidyltransferase family protein [Candidatus Fermentibacteria bacterium]|nr:CDP-alcohol phosphatidyltransferase family protein [Candidatus Fermentibacteria bacterium]
MTVAEWKHRFREGIEPLGRALVRIGITANGVTAAGAVLCLVAGVCLFRGQFRLGLLFFVAGGCCDFIDGAVARAGGTVSAFGAFLDSVLDRYSEMFLYVGLMGWFIRCGEMTVALASAGALAGSLLVSYARARAEGVGFSCSEGVAQRPERLMLLGVGLLCGGDLLRGVIWLVAVASHLTVIQRMVIVSRRARKGER